MCRKFLWGRREAGGRTIEADRKRLGQASPKDSPFEGAEAQNFRGISLQVFSKLGAGG